jgi:hypothetical protein
MISAPRRHLTKTTDTGEKPRLTIDPVGWSFSSLLKEQWAKLERQPPSVHVEMATLLKVSG